MEIVNIAFSFDKNYYRQAVISITSLLEVSNNVFFNIYLLVTQDIDCYIQKEIIEQLESISKNIEVCYIHMDQYFSNVYESRHITKASYFRLYLHKLLDIDKIIYADIDMIFKKNIADIFKIDMQEYNIAVVKDIYINLKNVWDNNITSYNYWNKYFSSYRGYYFNAGFIILNLKQIRKLCIDDELLFLLNCQFNYHDQDILNILYKDKKKLYLSPKFNVIANGFPKNYHSALDNNIMTKSDFLDIDDKRVIHYAGNKPWDYPDIEMSKEWWKYAKKSKYKYYFFNRLSFRKRPILINKILNIFFKLDTNKYRIKIKILGISIRFKRSKYL